MKCPYCGFVSFEHLSGCKKCSKDLSAHKSQFGIEYLEPVSLEMYSYAGGGAAMAAGAVATMAGSDDSGFGTDDFALDNDSGMLGGVEVEETDHLSLGSEGTDDISIDFGDDSDEAVATDEVSIDIGEVESSDEISLDLGEAEATDEISLDLGEAEAADEISLDLGEAEAADEISLDLGEAEADDEISLDLGEAEADEEISLEIDEVGAGDDISLELNDTDGDDEISLEVADEAPSRGAVAEDGGIEIDFGSDFGDDSGFSLDLGEDLSDDTNMGAVEADLAIHLDEPVDTDSSDIGGIEIALDDVDTASPDKTMVINRGDVEAIDDGVATVADDDFADIELSLEDEDLFGVGKQQSAPLSDDDSGLGLDTNLDLGDLSLEIGDDELGFDFDDTDAKLD